MKKKVIIFGATGSIGAYLAVELRDKFDIIAVGRRKSDNGFFADYGIDYYSIDIQNKDDFRKIKEKSIHAVVHLAGAMPANNAKQNDTHQYIESIVLGTLNVLEFCRVNSIDRIIFGQSHSDVAYLMGQGAIPSDVAKKFPLRGDHSIYSICKNAAVDLIEHYYYQYGLKRFVLRLPTVYAYHPNPFYYVDGIKKRIAYRYMIDSAVRGDNLEIWGDPNNKKDNTYIKDAIQLIELCLNTPIAGGVYNLGTGFSTSLEDTVKGIQEIFNTKENKSQILHCPEKPSVKEYLHDIQKAIDELGYRPHYSYKRLLEDYKVYYETEPFRKLWGKREDYE